MGDSQAKTKEFLGTGIAFPMKVENGRLATNSLEEHVRQSIVILLKSGKNERVMNPEFGAGLDRYVFSGMVATTELMVRNLVNEVLIRFEPRIDVLKVDTSLSREQPELINVFIEYRIRMTDSVDNLVYPFYLERGQE